MQKFPGPAALIRDYAANILRRVFEVIVLFEAGAWDELQTAAAGLQIDDDVIPPLFSYSVD